MKNVILVMMALVGWVACTASQAQPVDSTGAGRAISAQGTISSSTATTGSYTPTPVLPPVAPGPFANSRYQPWTLAFQGQEKCMFVAWMGSNNDITLCARITNDGSGNAELYQPANKLGEVDFRPNGWFESTYPQYARQWPNWPVAPATESVALKKIWFYYESSRCLVTLRSGDCGAYTPSKEIYIEPILGPSGLASDWRFNYFGQNCLEISRGRYWSSSCSLPYVPLVIDWDSNFGV